MLIVKIPTTINDSSLKRVGEFKIELTGEKVSGTAPLVLTTVRIGGDLCPARIVGDAYFTNEAGTQNLGKELTTISTYTYISREKTGTLFIGNKTMVQQIMLSSSVPGGFMIDMAEIAYNTGLDKFTCPGPTTKGDIGDLYRIANNFNNFGIYENGISGNIEVFKNNTKLTDFVIQRTKCTGNIVEAFGNKMNLKRVYSRYSNNIEGNPTDVFDKMVQNGRKSGDLEWTTPDNTVLKVYFDSTGWHYSA